MKRTAVILAAGKGVRMKSDLPKVFHKIGGRPMLELVLDSVNKAGFDDVFIVVGYRSEVIKEYFKDSGIFFVEQKEQLGTGHAVMQVEPFIKEEGIIAVLSGDMPFISAGSIKKLMDIHQQSKAAATIATAVLADAGHYGRIVKDRSGSVMKIVEAKDAGAEEKEIKEINSGIYCFDSKKLFEALKSINTDNAQGEFYLTDVIGICASKGQKVAAMRLEDNREAKGINTREELAEAERELYGK